MYLKYSEDLDSFGSDMSTHYFAHFYRHFDRFKLDNFTVEDIEKIFIEIIEDQKISGFTKSNENLRPLHLEVKRVISKAFINNPNDKETCKYYVENMKKLLIETEDSSMQI